jgi:hypothetical protein
MFRSVVLALALALPTPLAFAQEYKVEKLDGGPPADKLSPEIAKLIGDSGCKVLRGEARTLCEIWTVKEIDVSKGKTNDMVLYPLEPGQLIGVIRLPRKTTDFRNQEVASGVYNLRYGQQPVDGAHVGTFPTRDFVLLLPAEEDKSAATIADYKMLTKASAASAGTSHPAIYPLLKPSEGESSSIRHDEEKDWWIVRFPGAGKQAFEMVIVGHAEE